MYSFLKLNANFQTSSISQLDFEEVQFFNDKHYFQGIDWYFDRFDEDKSADNYHAVATSRKAQLFDKSATYFDDPKVPRRAFALLPEAYIITLLINPADRAYSWYQHMRAHGDFAATRMTFEQLLMDWNPSYTNITSAYETIILFDNTTSSSSSSSRTMTTKASTTTLAYEEQKKLDLAAAALRRRCLHPGYFASHLVKWLNYYPTKQIIIIDGEWFRFNPIAVMHKLQLLLRAEQTVDYSKLLVFNEQKGFYCYRDQTGDALKCLGPSKGRKYEPMSQEVREHLNRHYWQHNRQLAKLLYEIGQPLPAWLEATIES